MNKSILDILSSGKTEGTIHEALTAEQQVIMKVAIETGYFEGKIGLDELTYAYNKELRADAFVLKNYEKLFGNKPPSQVRKELCLEGKEI